jgi:hypothetical protein
VLQVGIEPEPYSIGSEIKTTEPSSTFTICLLKLNERKMQNGKLFEGKLKKNRAF